MDIFLHSPAKDLLISKIKNVGVFNMLHKNVLPVYMKDLLVFNATSLEVQVVVV